MSGRSTVEIFGIPRQTSQRIDRDVAVTSWETYLLAGSCLIELNALRQEVSRWDPQSHGLEEVLTVDELYDGRVAVGLRSLLEIVVLKRDRRRPGKWFIDQKIRGLHGVPEQISVCENLLAIKERLPNKTEVAIFSLSDGVELLREDMGYITQCVCVTPNRFITSSELIINERGNAEPHYRLECHNHSGHSLWRRFWDSFISDISSSPGGAWFFLAVMMERRVAIIGADNGLWKRDVVYPFQGICRHPWKVSVSKQGRPEMLAIMWQPEDN